MKERIAVYYQKTPNATWRLYRVMSDREEVRRNTEELSREFCAVAVVALQDGAFAPMSIPAARLKATGLP